MIETSEDAAAAEEALSLHDRDDEPTEAEAHQPVSDLLEQVGRDVGSLFAHEIELAAARNSPELRRAIRDVVVALGAALACLTAFVLANWAAVNALSLVLPDWLAPLVLALGWVAVGVLLLVVLRSGEGVPGRRWWRVLGADQARIVLECEQARDEARQRMRDSLERLTGALASEAGEQIAHAAIPLAGGVVTAGEEIMDVADEIADALEDAVPGGGAIDRMVDIVLVPGRFSVRVTRTLLRRGDRSAPR